MPITPGSLNVSLNRKELFLSACRGEALPRVPVWMMRQAGRYLPEYRELRAKHAFLELCKTPDLAVEISMQPYRRLGVDAIIVFSDILIPAEAMGLQLELGDGGPNLPKPVRSLEAVRRLRQFDPEMETGFLMEAIRRIVRTAGPDVPVLGFAAAPWTLACYMVEGRTGDELTEASEIAGSGATTTAVRSGDGNGIFDGGHPANCSNRWARRAGAGICGGAVDAGVLHGGRAHG